MYPPSGVFSLIVEGINEVVTEVKAPYMKVWSPVATIPEAE